MQENNITIYTDGAYATSKDQGGWAFVVLKDGNKLLTNFNCVKGTTNNRMEMQAVIEACKWAKKNGCLDIEIVSDSMYVIGTMTLGYKKGKNIDLWETMENAVSGLNIKWTHVKGHNGNPHNNLCDILAVTASNAIIN